LYSKITSLQLIDTPDIGLCIVNLYGYNIQNNIIGISMAQGLFNIALERNILHSIIFEPNIMELCYEVGLKADDFYQPFHKNLFITVQGLYENSVVDEEFIKKKMGPSFDEIGMIEILSCNPISNIRPYAQDIKELTKLRKSQALANKILDNINTQQEYSSVLQIMHEGLEKLESNNEKLINITTPNEIVAKEAEFVCKKWLPFPKRAVSLVSAGGGVGKSFLLLQAAMRMVEDEGLKVFMWLSEDPIELTKHRYEMVARQVLKKSPDIYNEKLYLAGSDSETIQFLKEDRNSVSINGIFYQFKKNLQDYDVIILDPLIAFFGADENNNTHARQFINLFTRWATVENKTIIFIHHGTKNSSQSRGASAFVDAVRLVYQVELIKNNEDEHIEEHMRSIILAKDNNGAKKYFGGQRSKRQVFPEQKKASLVIEYEM